MNAHTPGPWEYIPDDGGTVGCVIGKTGWVCDYLNDPKPANARLIAAAPDLLEALEAFLRAPSVGSNGPGSSTIVVQDFNLRAARAAIAKATGETP